ncbi:HTH domain-containing protein [Neptunomonas japonica]|uniref:HTH domain-containing protein n=1 Tax=Neptunomonas japonica TaxID=417574 RepID=UPI00041D34BD|nr:HTH domain-containing protein [Neptunomonas japonica]
MAKQKIVDQEKVAQFIRDNNENMSGAQMAEKLEISVSMVTRIRRKAGVISPKMKARLDSTRDSDEMRSHAMAGSMSLDGLRHPW